MDEEEATQPATQQLPGHEGVAPSSTHNNYLSGVICLLHPSSPAAFAAVERLARIKPTHVLKIPDIASKRTSVAERPTTPQNANDDDAATQLATPGTIFSEEGLDIALRVEPGPKNPTLGFMFGRNPNKCDIVIGETSATRRISNQHFRIYQNTTGVLMLEDYSTNGTWVDSLKLGGATTGGPNPNGNTHALFAGSIIYVAPGDELLRFVVRIPNQSGSGLCPSRPRDSNALPFSVGIDPGPHIPPVRITPQLRPGAPRSPHRNLAAMRRAPGLKTHQMHTSITVQKDAGWNGGGIFKIEGIIGAGAFATVKRGVLRKTGEVFAIKVIKKRTVGGSVAVRKEADILEQLNHPNVVGCREYHEDKDHMYIVMEYVGGGDLGEYLKIHHLMREDKVQEVARQVLRAIGYVHGMGISHRDLKPDNILMVSEDPLVVKISDFGLAKMVQSEETFLKTFCGTMLYLAPEVYPGYATAMVNDGKRKRNIRDESAREDDKLGKQKKRYSQTVDMWSLGCVIHMLLTGKAPFEGKSADDMLNVIMGGYNDTSLLEKVLGRNCYEAKDFLSRLLQVVPTMRMDEQEALRHDWLNYDNNPSSSMEQDEDSMEVRAKAPEEEEEEEEGEGELDAASHDGHQESMVISGGDEEYQIVNANGRSASSSSPEEPTTPKPEDALLGAVKHMSFDHSADKVSTSGRNSPDDEVFQSIDANASESQMFRRHPTSAQGSSGVFPRGGYFMDSLEGSMAIPSVGVSYDSQNGEPLQYNTQNGFASQPAAISNPRGLRPLGRSVSDGSLAATEAMVGKLKVASESPSETPSPQGNGKQNGNVETSGMSSFEDAGVVYSTPLSLKARDSPPPPTPQQLGRRLSNPENSAPLSQPCNLPSSQPENSNFAKPNTPWGKLVPLPGSLGGSTISLNKQMIIIGRSSVCTHIQQDIRISKIHFAIQLADPECRIQPADNDNWRPKENMVAWFKVAGTNGCILNGRKKRKGTIGRIYHGDTIHFFKEEKDDQCEFIAFTCDFKIGNHQRFEPEVSDENMSVKQKATTNAHRVSMGISMATTMAIASPTNEQSEEFVNEV